MTNSITVDGQTITADDVRALRAQVERLRDLTKKMDDLNNRRGVILSVHIQELAEILEETPTQSLQAIRAEGFMAGQVTGGLPSHRLAQEWIDQQDQPEDKDNE
jgi:hypothetical protein